MANLSTEEISTWKNELLTQVSTIKSSITTCSGIAGEASGTVSSNDAALRLQWYDLQQLLTTAGGKLQTASDEYSKAIDGYVKLVQQNEQENRRKAVESQDKFKEEADALNNIDI